MGQSSVPNHCMCWALLSGHLKNVKLAPRISMVGTALHWKLGEFWTQLCGGGPSELEQA